MSAPRVAAAALCVLLALGAAALALRSGADGAATAEALPPAEPELVRECRSRGEPSGSPARGSIDVGPVSLPGGFHASPASVFASRADEAGFRRYLRGRRGRALPARQRRRLARLAEEHHAPLKYALLVRAGTRALVAIAPRDRRHAAFLYGNTLDRRPAGRQIGPYWSVRVSDGQDAIALQACDEDEPLFSGPGTVGPYTAFPGGLVVAGARCVTFQVWVRGRARPFERRIPFGRPDCPA